MADRVRRGYAERLRLIQLLRYGGPGWLTGVPLAALVLVVSTPVASVVTGRLVDSALGARRVSTTLTPLIALVAVVTARQVAEALVTSGAQVIAFRVDAAVRRQVRTLALAPRYLTELADPAFQLDALRACDLGDRWRLRSVGAAASGQLLLFFRFCGGLASAVVLAAYFPWLSAGLVVGTVTMRAIVRRQWLGIVAVDDERAALERQKEYWSELAAGGDAAKEIRLFGLADWVMSRRERAQREWFEPSWAARRHALRRQGWPASLAAGTALAALLVPGLAAARGELGSGQLAVCLVAAWGIFQMGAMGLEAFDIEYGLGAVRALDRLRSRPGGSAPSGPAARHTGPGAGTSGAVAPGPPEIVFDQVRFRYPGSGRDVLAGLTLRIAPGEVLGIVGVNGAGKTTLIKLLASLHPPSGGRITVDGADLRDLDVAGWRRRLAVVFQDFVRYPVAARANIALAAPEASSDGPGIVGALRQAGAQDLVESLPAGLDTLLWRGGSAGTDLSGGQWQKLAIARALFAVAHGRQLLVLDEPTAHLDVAAETGFYDKVVNAVDRRASVVLISHRLSTLRRADRIVLLSDGRVTESGSHAELMASGGEYARLFHLQSRRFQEPVA